MMTKKTKTAQKQSESEMDFTLDNLKNASAKFSKTLPKEKSTNISPLYIRAHQDVFVKFNTMMFDFQKKTSSYKNFSKTTFFCYAVEFLYSYFKEQGTLLSADEDYILFISRAGSRGKENPRRYKASEVDNIYVKLTDTTLSHYYDLIYSYMTMKNEDPFYYSTSYFFYDFVNLIKDHFSNFVKSHS